MSEYTRYIKHLVLSIFLRYRSFLETGEEELESSS